MCEPIDLNPIPRCSCGEPLDHEAEQDAGECFNCQAEAAGIEMPEPRETVALIYSQLDAFLGVTHRRKAS